MSDKEFLSLVELKKMDNGFVPINENGMELLLTLKPYEILTVSVKNNRDLKFHKCYFALLKFIYFYLPDNFKKVVDKKHFYQFVKGLSGMAKVVYEFKTIPPLVEYESIKFGNVNQKQFEGIVRQQLSAIYTELLPKFELEYIIDEIEEQFERLLKKIEI